VLSRRRGAVQGLPDRRLRLLRTKRGAVAAGPGVAPAVPLEPAISPDSRAPARENHLSVTKTEAAHGLMPRASPPRCLSGGPSPSGSSRRQGPPPVRGHRLPPALGPGEGRRDGRTSFAWTDSGDLLITAHQELGGRSRSRRPATPLLRNRSPSRRRHRVTATARLAVAQLASPSVTVTVTVRQAERKPRPTSRTR
jgi:hypothetical protein